MGRRVMALLFINSASVYNEFLMTRRSQPPCQGSHPETPGEGEGPFLGSAFGAFVPYCDQPLDGPGDEVNGLGTYITAREKSGDPDDHAQNGGQVGKVLSQGQPSAHQDAGNQEQAARGRGHAANGDFKAALPALRQSHYRNQLFRQWAVAWEKGVDDSQIQPGCAMP